MVVLGKRIPALVWQALLMGLLGLAGIVFIPALVRLVDAQVVSTVLIAQVCVYCLVLLVQYGFAWSGPAALGRSVDAELASGVWAGSIRCKLFLLVPVLLVFALGYWLLGNNQVYFWGFALLLLAYALNSNWFLQARNDFASGVGFALLGVVVSVLLLAIVSWGFISGELNGLLVVLVLTVPQIALGLGSWWRARGLCAQSGYKAEVFGGSSLKPLVADAPLVLSQLLLLASTTLGTVVVGGLADAETATAYAATEKLFNLGATVLVGLYMVVYPRLARDYYEDRCLYWRQLGKLLVVALGVGVILLMVLAWLGQPLLGVYLTEPLAAKVSTVLLPFGIWLMLCLSQHVLVGYLVFARQHGRVLMVNVLVLLVTVLVGYGSAMLDPVAWVYGMIVGQLLAVGWLLRCYKNDVRALV